MQYFNIQVASQLSGVASATIRAWEKRYNAVVPERAENKHRLYSEKDIEKLALLFQLTEFGQSIGKIAHLELDQLKQVYSTLMHRPYDDRRLLALNHERPDLARTTTNLKLALSAYKLDIVSHELGKARSQLDARELCLDLLTPLQEQVKELNESQQHALRTLVNFHLGELVEEHYQKADPTAELVLLKGMDLMPMLLCLHYGLRFIHMGPEISPRPLLEAAQALKARAIVLDVPPNEYLGDNQSGLGHGPEIWSFKNARAFDDFLNRRSQVSEAARS